MILSFVLTALLWPPVTFFYSHFSEQILMIRLPNTFKPSEFQALSMKLDYGTSPEPQRLSRREKIALKLTQITRTTTN